jgi:phosphopantothenoylcysteine decarboxylase/phosphopantothenate--cysteine ligase
MNVRMWLHAATRRNVQQLVDDGVQVIGPAEGEMACGEHGPGRLPEPEAIVDWLSDNDFLPSISRGGGPA